MTEKEVYRCNIIQQVKDKRITQVRAAEILKISDRQVRNLLRILHNEGPKGLISRQFNSEVRHLDVSTVVVQMPL